MSFALLLLLGLAAAAGSPQDTFDAIVVQNKPVVRVSTPIHILYFSHRDGFDHSAKDHPSLKSLLRFLEAALPSRVPTVTSSASYDRHRPLCVEFDFVYTGSAMPQLFVDAVSHRILGGAVDSGRVDDAGLPILDVNMDVVESYLESVVSSELSTKPKPGPHIVVLIDLDTDAVFGGQSVRYVYTEKGSRRTNAWVSPTGIMILDMSAGPVAFGSTGTDEGIVDTDTWKESSSSSGPLLFARAARTISAGIQSLLTPDMLVPHIPLLDTRGDLDWRSAVSQVFHRPRVVIIDVMVLSDHSLSEEHIDLDATALAEAVRPLLQPDQNVMVSFEFKRLTEVPHIAVGLAKSLTSTGVLRRVYGTGRLVQRYSTRINARILGDALDQHAREGELSDGTPYPPNADVIRVLVLSLARAPSDGDEVKEANVLLFDNHERVAVDEGHVLVLHSPSSVMQSGCFSDDSLVLEDGSMVMHQVVGGLTQLLGHILPPGVHWSPRHNRVLHDHTWAFGALPIGCFARASPCWLDTAERPVETVGGDLQASALTRSLARSSLTLLRLDAVVGTLRESLTELQDFVFEHLYDPFSDDLGHHEQVSRLFVFSNLTAQQESSRLTATFPAKIVSELHAQLRKILELVSSAEGFIRRGDVKAGMGYTATLLKEVEAFTASVDETLSAAGESLSCCIRRHHIGEHHEVVDAVWYLVVIGGGMASLVIACGLVVILRRQCARKEKLG